MCGEGRHPTVTRRIEGQPESWADDETGPLEQVGVMIPDVTVERSERNLLVAEMQRLGLQRDLFQPTRRLEAKYRRSVVELDQPDSVETLVCRA